VTADAEYRFGIGGLPVALPELREAIRRYEDAGFDFVAKGDHVGSPPRSRCWAPQRLSASG
jgi:alkanesulfonate monooxygenase SsuD/methylene tetrahydromethanopterin reductase-like flavin-dependent oxidoreductase (luciferase family)